MVPSWLNASKIKCQVHVISTHNIATSSWWLEVNFPPGLYFYWFTWFFQFFQFFPQFIVILFVVWIKLSFCYIFVFWDLIVCVREEGKWMGYCETLGKYGLNRMLPPGFDWDELSDEGGWQQLRLKSKRSLIIVSIILNKHRDITSDTKSNEN